MQSFTARVLGAFSLAALLSAPALACKYPSAGDIDMPDGASASQEQMVEAQQQVKTYVAAVDEYLECLKNEVDDTKADEETMAEVQRIRDSRHNAAIDAMEAVAGRFNEEVRAFKAANP